MALSVVVNSSLRGGSLAASRGAPASPRCRPRPAQGRRAPFAPHSAPFARRRDGDGPNAPATSTIARAVPADSDRLSQIAPSAPRQPQEQEQQQRKRQQRFLGEGLATQEDAYDALAAIAIELLRDGNEDEDEEEENTEKERRRRRRGRRVVVGLAGSPGSGKTTAASAVVQRINDAVRKKKKEKEKEKESGSNGRDEGEGDEDEVDEDEDGDVAVVLPMDGFHLTRAQLASSADPEAMLARRGAHWTFDAEAFVDSVARVVGAADLESESASGSDSSVIAVPSFDHGVGDPAPGAIRIKPHHRIVLVEGNYLLLPFEPWSRLSGAPGGGGGDGGDGGGEGGTERPLLDQTWFLDVGVAEAMARVARRQLADGVSPGDSARRISGNDGPNAELVASTKGRADVVVRGDLPRRGGGRGGGEREGPNL